MPNKSPKVVKVWTIYHKPSKRFWLSHIEEGIYARGIITEKVSRFFTPSDYEVIQVEIRPKKRG